LKQPRAGRNLIAEGASRVDTTSDVPLDREEANAGDVPDNLTASHAGAVSFPELVFAHFRWQQDLHGNGAAPKEALEAGYHEKLRSFEQEEGRILESYWSTQRASAVALTVKTPSGLMSRVKSLFLGRDDVIRLHRATDWLAREEKIADLLHHCDTLAIKVSEVLRGPTERIAMQWIYGVESYLLGFIERSRGRASSAEVKSVVTSQRDELILIEKYYARAGGNAARLVYFWGMMIGVVVSGLLGAALAGILWPTGWFEEPHTLGSETFFVCYVAGGLGAIISVLMRMSSNRFTLDYEVGRPAMRRLGSFRPFIGAVFGITLYFLVQSEILRIQPPDDEATAFFFFAILAFLAGFNERWTKVMLGTAQKTIAASLGDSGSKEEEDEE
jgi:hypothetical protein